jgi:hypothetical protein
LRKKLAQKFKKESSKTGGGPAPKSPPGIFWCYLYISFPDTKLFFTRLHFGVNFSGFGISDPDPAVLVDLITCSSQLFLLPESYIN